MNKYTRVLEIAPGAAPGPVWGKGGPASGCPSHLGSRATSGWQPQASGGLQGRGEAGVRVCPEVQDRGTGMEPKGAGQRDRAVPKGEGQRERTVVRCAGQKDRDSAKRCGTEGQSRAQEVQDRGTAHCPLREHPRPHPTSPWQPRPGSPSPRVLAPAPRQHPACPAAPPLGRCIPPARGQRAQQPWQGWPLIPGHASPGGTVAVTHSPIGDQCPRRTIRDKAGAAGG